MNNIRSFQSHTPRIAADAYVDETALIIGDVEIGSGSNIWPGVIARGDVHAIRVGAFSNIQDACVLHVSHDSEFLPNGAATEVGNYVTVGHKVILHGCRIEDEVLIGMGAIVMDQAVVQRNVVVGAGAVVPGGKVLESGFLYVGSPARRIRELSEQELKYFRYSADHYLRLAKAHYAGGEY